jgi:RNA polymerase sigma factor (sigma-70 family)
VTTDDAGETGSEGLVRKYQAGDDQALARLWARYLPRLTRWAHGRLAPMSRGETNTDDLVQDTFLRSLAHLRHFEPRGSESVFAYFRTIVINQVRDYARKSARHPQDDLEKARHHAGSEPSPLEQAVGNEAVAKYERALAQLSEGEQQVVIAYVELRCTDREIAELFEKASADAARMARNRAMAKLARLMAADFGRAPERH